MNGFESKCELRIWRRRSGGTDVEGREVRGVDEAVGREKEEAVALDVEGGE